jgi:fructose/tagatose bisphosphate aldolase
VKARGGETPRAIPRAIIVHGLADAEAALAAAEAAGVPVILLSAPGAASYAGIGWFKALAREAGRRCPEARYRAMLDCGDRPDLAQAAWREGMSDVVFTGRKAIAEKLDEIARRRKARLHRQAPEALDLFGAEDRAAACADWLKRR